MPNYSVQALVNLSSYGSDLSYAQQQFAKRLTSTVKNGGAQLKALLTITARSLFLDQVDRVDDLLWGVYPSSGNTNRSDEVLSDFTHRLRTTVSRVWYASREEPLFIRHSASVKRSSGQSQGDRTDPTGQVTTIHLNPFYADKIGGKNVVVIDDCTTYGVSFGVAAALLRSAGARSVRGIALGKFGNRLGHYNIQISTNPFAPVDQAGFQVISEQQFIGQTDHTAQDVLARLIT